MKFTQIRNATALIEYNGTTFLIDPYLSPKDTYPPFPGCYNPTKRHPMVELPCSVDDIIKKTDAVIVTHTHLDHWDDAAVENLPKDIKIFVQEGISAYKPDMPLESAELIRSQGFTNVEVMSADTEYKGINLRMIEVGQHGDSAVYGVPELATMLGDAMGVVFQAKGEPTVYLIGDSIWNKGVARTLQQYNPDVVILNACLASYGEKLGEHPIIMGAEDFTRVHHYLPKAKMIATHMDTVHHAKLTRDELKNYVRENGLEKFVDIPDDGETLTFG